MIGETVSYAGDINNDGLDDIMIGTSFPSNSKGKVYVVYGSRQKIYGCTDSLANNFNPSANCEDDSCIYPCLVQLCNQDCTLGDIETFNTTTCQCEVSIVTINGCTDINACNYNPNANCDSGNCNINYGCTNSNYCEYDPLANCDDGSCLTLNNTSLIIFQAATVPPSNANSNDGYIQLITLGGSGNYSYTWSPNVSSNNFASNLDYGTYTIEVQDITLCGNVSTTITLQNPNCPSVLNFTNANPSTNILEYADDIITTSESLNANRTYKAGHYQTIEYIELQQGFQSGLYHFEALNEQCDLND